MMLVPIEKYRFLQKDAIGTHGQQQQKTPQQEENVQEDDAIANPTPKLATERCVQTDPYYLHQYKAPKRRKVVRHQQRRLPWIKI